jgi:hypothetical protein
MDFNATVDLIIKDLDEAREIIDDLKNYPGVPLLQIEMAKSKCKSAGEIIALLKSLRNEVPVPDHKQPTPTITGIKDAPAGPVTGSEAPGNIHPVSETPHPPKGENIEVGSSPSGKKPDSSTVGDSFSLTDRLNEQMGSMRGENNVSEIIKTKPLANLDDAIGVNDKFLFIRELFNGSPESYNQALGRLNGVRSFDDAKAVLTSFTGDNKETRILKQFLDIIKRKFPSDE